MVRVEVYYPDPEDPKEVMDAVTLLRQLIEARPVVSREMAPDHYEEFYLMPDGGLVPENDANPADELQAWLEAVWDKGLDLDSGA